MLNDASKVLQRIFSFFAEICTAAQSFQTQQSSRSRGIARWRRCVLQWLATRRQRTQNFALRRFRIEKAATSRIIKALDHRFTNLHCGVVVANITCRLPRIHTRVRQKGIVVQHSGYTLPRLILI